MMTPKKIYLLIIFSLLSLLISACSSTIYASTGWHGLTSSTDTAYLAAGNQVYAVDLKTGSEVWRYPAKPNTKVSFYANPQLTSDGQLIVPSYDKILYSLNPATGAENWKYTDSTNRLVASPLVTQDMIFQPSTDHHIYAVDMRGRMVWVRETGAAIWAQPASAPDCGCVYVASMDHYVYSFEAKTGKLLWKSPELGGAIVGSPAVNDQTLYVGTFGKEMIALDAGNGAVKWRFATQDWIWSGPAFSNGTIYFGDLGGNFYALNASDGTSLWRIQPQNPIVGTPAIHENQIYLTTEGDTLLILDAAGNVVSSRVIGGAVYAPPVIAGDTVIVSPTTADSLLIAMTLDGTQKWTFSPAKK